MAREVVMVGFGNAAAVTTEAGLDVAELPAALGAAAEEAARCGGGSRCWFKITEEGGGTGRGADAAEAAVEAAAEAAAAMEAPGI